MYKQSSLFKNTLYNTLGLVIPAIVALLSTRLLISNYGELEYSIYNIALNIAGYLVVFDLGIRQSIITFISESLSINDNIQKKKYYISDIFKVSRKILFNIGLPLALIIFLLVFFGYQFISVPTVYKDFLTIITVIFLIDFCNELYFAPQYALITATERFDILTITNILRTLVILTFLYILVTFKFSIIYYCILLFLAKLIQRFYLIKKVKIPQEVESKEHLSPDHVISSNKLLVKELIQNGKYLFCINLSSKFIYQSDILILSFLTNQLQ